MLTIFKLFNFGLTIYLIYFLEKIKSRLPTKNLLIKYSSFIVEAQMLIGALTLLCKYFFWVQVIFGIFVGILALILCQLFIEDLNNWEFISKLDSDRQKMLDELKYRVEVISASQNQNCPMKLDCKVMGIKNDFCVNFENCKRYYRD